ncbi:MAG: hypothetical protein V1917_04395 [Candidatus Gottesmanbacteria bacterium]
MHRNTFVLVTILAVIAALLVGFNMGKKFNPTPEAEIIPTPTASNEASQTSIYKNTYCGITLSYPLTMSVTEIATGSAKFSSETDAVILACQKDIPGIAIAEENIETIPIGSISATLYHTTTPKDGTPIDILMVRHPKTNMDVLISGIGSAFTTIIHSLTLIPLN